MRVLLVAALLAAAPLAAQEQPAFPSAVPDSASPQPGWGPDSAAFTSRPWVRPVTSLLVPGTGQLLAGQARGLVYLALEVWLVSRVIAYDRRGNEQADRYRALAYDVARSQFSAVRVDGAFEYYESMEKYVESGVYDADPGQAFVPESDTTTFNGSVWLLARRTFFANPDSIPHPLSPQYLRAISFYRDRAQTDQFRWSWRGARLEQDVFRGSIKSSDDAYRSRTNYLGAVVVNHVASAIDALVSARARHRNAVPRVEVRPDLEGAALVWTGTFRGPKL